MTDAARNRDAGLAPRLERRIGAAMESFARVLAWAGGGILIAVILLSVANIAGRALRGYSDVVPAFRALGPVPGHYEMVEMATAVAVCAFLPWCQIARAHAAVDLFVSRVSPRTRAALGLVANVLMAAAAVFIAWRLQLGLSDRLRYNDTTMILRVPVWWAYAACLVGLWAFALSALYTVWRSINEVASGAERGGIERLS